VATFKCLVNGTIDDATRRRVHDALAGLTEARFGIPAASVSVSFTEIPTGHWFTAGEPSAASMVLGTVPAGTSQEVREDMMADICAAFSEITGAEHYRIMVVAADEH